MNSVEKCYNFGTLIAFGQKTGVLSVEAISKPQIAFEGKAGADDKAQHTREYVSILKRPSTQPSGARWGSEMASRV